MNEIKLNLIKDWLQSQGISETLTIYLNALILSLFVIVIAIIFNFITKKIILSILKRMIRKSKNTYDDVFLEKKVFNRLSQVAPAIIINLGAKIALAGLPLYLTHIVESSTYIYLIVICMMVINSILDALHEIYKYFPISKTRTIKGYVQTVKIIFYIVGSILILSVLLGKSAYSFLAGLSAMTAVLILVFKDVLLGFVSSIQLTANDLVKPGDWISLPKHNIDGTVTDINLTSIKIQNFDKSISSLPTYLLTSESFSNWKGLDESEGRRIKRSFSIDISGIHFIDKQFIEKLSSQNFTKSFIENIFDSITEIGELEQITNLNMFRNYLDFYLRNHPKIINEMTLLVRHLQPSDSGLPIEIYAFTTEKKAFEYENIQSEIFEHIFSVINLFDLTVYQSVIKI